MGKHKRFPENSECFWTGITPISISNEDVKWTDVNIMVWDTKISIVRKTKCQINVRILITSRKMQAIHGHNRNSKINEGRSHTGHTWSISRRCSGAVIWWETVTEQCHRGLMPIVMDGIAFSGAANRSPADAINTEYAHILPFLWPTISIILHWRCVVALQRTPSHTIITMIMSQQRQNRWSTMTCSSMDCALGSCHVPSDDCRLNRSTKEKLHSISCDAHW